MKKYFKRPIYLTLFLLLAGAGILHATMSQKEVEETERRSANKEGMESNAAESAEISWIDFETAYDSYKESGKKVFIYIYTDWCSYCKRMENSTFTNDSVIALLNENFIPIKFNAESKEGIRFMEQEFNFVNQGNRGYHELAAALLQGKMAFPSVVFLSENFEMIQPIPGYQPPENMRNLLDFLGNNLYEEMTWQEYTDSKS